MPNPTISDVHVNRPLSDLSVAYLQDQDNFIASKVFPNIPSLNKSDMYYLYKREDFYANDMQERAPGTESAGGGYRLQTATFNTRVFALHKDVDDQIRANADSVLQPDREAVEYLTLKALIKRELDWATAYFKTGLWTNEVAGQTGASSGSNIQFWNLSTSTPIEDIRAGIFAMLKLTGYEPKCLVLGATAWQRLQDNPDLIDRVRYSGGSNDNPAKVSTVTVAALLGLQEIYVMKAVYNTAKEGQAYSGAFVGDKDALLLYKAPAAGIMTPSAGYTFSWTGMFGAGTQGNRIKKFRIERLASDRVEIEMAYAFQLVSADMGYFFHNCVQ